MNLLNLLTKKNLKLYKRRTIVTIIGITLSVALIMAVSTMYNSMVASMIKFEKREVGNFHAEFKNVPAIEVNNIKNNRKVSDVFIVENVGYASINSLNESKPYAHVKKFTKESLKNLSVNLIEVAQEENINAATLTIKNTLFFINISFESPHQRSCREARYKQFLTKS